MTTDMGDDFPAIREYMRTHKVNTVNDHKADANAAVDALHDWQADQGITDATLTTVATEAQVHATLYLAEQQRIANLIAFMVQYSDPSIKEDTFVKFHPDVFREITSGIGITS